MPRPSEWRAELRRGRAGIPGMFKPIVQTQALGPPKIAGPRPDACDGALALSEAPNHVLTPL